MKHHKCETRNCPRQGVLVDGAEGATCSACNQPLVFQSFAKAYRKQIVRWSVLAVVLIYALVHVNRSMATARVNKLLDGVAKSIGGIRSDLDVLEKTPIPMDALDGRMGQLRAVSSVVEDAGDRVETALRSNAPDDAAKELSTLSQARDTAASFRDQIIKQAGTAELKRPARDLLGRVSACVDDVGRIKERELLRPGTAHGRRVSGLLDDLDVLTNDLERVVQADPGSRYIKAVNERMEKISARIAAAELAIKNYVPPPERKPPFPAAEADYRIMATAELCATLVVPLLESYSGSLAFKEDDADRWFFQAESGPLGGRKVLVSPASSTGEAKAAGGDLIFLPFGDKSLVPGVGTKGSPAGLGDLVCFDALVFKRSAGSPAFLGPEQIRGKGPWKDEELGDLGFAVARQFRLIDGTAAPSTGADRGTVLSLYHRFKGEVRTSVIPMRVGPEFPDIWPEPAAISSGDYPYAYPVFCYSIGANQDSDRAFLAFIASDLGQSVVSKNHYVDTRIKAFGVKATALEAAKIAEALGLAKGTQVEALRLTATAPFEFNESLVAPKVAKDLSSIGSFLQEYYPPPRWRTVVLGHTDSVGGKDYNDKLSIERARTVVSRLTSAGVGAKPAGLADNSPRDTNHTDEGRFRNRRADIWVVKF